MHDFVFCILVGQCYDNLWPTVWQLKYVPTKRLGVDSPLGTLLVFYSQLHTLFVVVGVVLLIEWLVLLHTFIVVG